MSPLYEKYKRGYVHEEMYPWEITPAKEEQSRRNRLGYIAWVIINDVFMMKTYAFLPGEAALQLEFEKLTNPRIGDEL